MREDEGEYRTGQSKVDQVACQAISRPLNWSARSFGLFNCLDDFPKSGITANCFRLNFENSGLIHRPRVDTGARNLLHRHGLARNRGLIDERVAAYHHAVHRHSTARPDQDDIAGAQFA